MTGHARPALAAVSLVALAFLALPVVALVVRAATGGDLLASARDRAVLDALALSLFSTSVSLVVILALGTPLAFVLARRTFRGKAVVEALVDLPIVLPPSVAGLALLLAFGRRGTLGPVLEAVDVTVPFTTIAVIVAQTFVAAPFYVRAARAGFQSVERDLEDAARVDGAGEGGVFRHVTVPMSGAALGAGAVLAWARSLGEFGATIMFAGNVEGRTQTLPLLVYSEFQVTLDRAVAAAAVLIVAALAVLVAVRLTRGPAALVSRALEGG